jgi:hypothetical protein
MKRRITPEQLQELTEEQKQRLREWWKPEIGDIIMSLRFPDNKEKQINPQCLKTDDNGKWLTDEHLPLFSIGQMIELLESKDQCLNITKRTDLEGWGYEIQLRHIGYCKFSTGELVDALWQAVKAVL